MSNYDFLSKIVSGSGTIANAQSKPMVQYAHYEYSTGVDVYGDIVYSYCDGVVVAVGEEYGLKSVIIQYDANSCLQYTHLLVATVQSGDVVQAGFDIGVAYKYVHFEYLTRESSNWPVRIGTETYYKTDPLRMLGDN